MRGIKDWLLRRTSPTKGRQSLEAEEDLLKGLYHAGTLADTAQMQELATARAIGLATLPHLVGTLVLKGDLLTEPYRLSEQGEQRALRLIRAHRIYEKYLAEHSGHRPEDWHRLANRMEHHISAEEQSRMISLLRNPLFDPHGDPIPTTELDMPAQTEQTSAQIHTDGWFRVVHIEDDDIEVFSLINSLNLARGSVFYIVGVDEQGCDVLYEGEAIYLPTSACQALSLVELSLSEDEQTSALGVRRLTRLEEGQESEIVGLSPSCRGAMRRRLMDLGFVKGSRISIEMKSPMRNPVAYVVRGTAIALRQDQACYILIK